MSEAASPLWPEIRTALLRVFPEFYELESGGSLALDLGNDGWLLEVRPEGKIVCQYGVAMEDVMSLMSEGTPEDLGTDEVAKQAKFFIQPAVSKYRALLLQSGFAEESDMNEEYVAVMFERPVDFANLPKVQDLIRWCCRQIGGTA